MAVAVERRKPWPVILTAVVLLFAGCGAQSGHSAPTMPTMPTEPTEPSPSAEPITPPPAPAPVVTDDLLASFSAMAEGVPAEIGIAISDGADTRSFGTELSGAAWSTAKVPLAVAAFQEFGDAAQASAAPAISQSDNAAAEELWSMLGSGTRAAEAVAAVLRQGGDTETVVQSERVRAGYTPFGQTEWGADAQARFAARLPCIAGSAPVLQLMQHLGGGQQWGLAGESVAAKGGWGPGVDGMYLVRQLAVLGDDTAALGVALLARPYDGTFASGIAAVDQLAEWVRQNAAQFARGRC